MKLIIIACLILSSCLCTEVSNSLENPVYSHVALTERHNSPLDIHFNPRIDMLNASGREVRAHKDGGDMKASLRAELARQFSFGSQFLLRQNMNMMDRSEYVNDISTLKGFAKVLQSRIIEKANAVIDKMNLLDLKLKEQNLVEHEVSEIKSHPGNIGSNLGNNLLWKERLEELVSNAASVHDQFDVSLNGICAVLRRINLFVNSMEISRIPSAKIRQPLPETQYYPNDQLVLEKAPTVHAFGPKLGQHNHSYGPDVVRAHKNSKSVNTNNKAVINLKKNGKASNNKVVVNKKPVKIAKKSHHKL